MVSEEQVVVGAASEGGKNMKRLNLGCGMDKKKGYINIDRNKGVNPDMVLDLNKLPYPFKTNEIDEIYSSHILEHIKEEPITVLDEYHRILKPGGKLILRVPHFTKGFAHPSHRWGFNIMLFEFLNRNMDYYNHYESEKGWKVTKRRLNYRTYPKGLVVPIHKIISFFANLSPKLCEAVWCYWFGGFEEIYFEATPKKGQLERRIASE